MGRPNGLHVGFKIDDLDAFMDSPHVNWVKFPDFGMPDDLNAEYHKVEFRYGLSTSDTEEAQLAIQSVIRKILDCKTIKHIHKLHLIYMMLSTNKSYANAWDSIYDEFTA